MKNLILSHVKLMEFITSVMTISRVVVLVIIVALVIKFVIKLLVSKFKAKRFQFFNLENFQT